LSIKIKPRIGFAVMLHPFEVNADKAPEIFEKSLLLLKSIDSAEIISADEFINEKNAAQLVGKQFNNAKVDVICLKLATWSSDDLLFELLAESDVPIILWAYPHMHAGSLCGAQQFNCVLKEVGKECKFVYDDTKETLNDITSYSNAIAVQNRLRHLIIGQIGDRTQGMREVICDESSLKHVFGARISKIELNEFINMNMGISEDEISQQWEKVKSSIEKINISDNTGLDVIRIFYILKKFIEKKNLDALTIECYPEFMGKTCLGFSLLADEGIACACEGDVHGALLMWIMMKLSGGPVHNTDTLYVHKEDNSVTGSHCGCGSIKLAESREKVEINPVRLADGGACVVFPSKPGIVTMANLIGKAETYRLGVILGEAIKTDMTFPGNPLRVKLPVSIKDYLKFIEECALGHHWIVAYGDITKELKIMAKQLNINLHQLESN